MVNRNTEWYYFKGKSSWEHLQSPDTAGGFGGNWNVRVYLVPDSLAQFNKLKEQDGEVAGIQNEVNEDTDGSFVTFRRPTHRKWNNVETPLIPPMVVDSDNQPFSGYIGHGSDVTVKVEFYKFNKSFKQGKGKALRLVAVKIDHLVPLKRENLTPEQDKAAMGLDEQLPPQLF